MSKQSRGSKRREQLHTPPPANDWLFACPKGLPTARIAAALTVTGRPVTEVSARSWQADWQMANTLMDAYGSLPYLPNMRWLPGEPVGWQLRDWIVVKRYQSTGTVRRGVQITRFVGELILVRESWVASENVLAFLLDIVDAQVKWSRKHDRPLARIALVLEGWEKATVEGRVGHRVAWAVNPLPPELLSFY
jgi:hypothetical protein